MAISKIDAGGNVYDIEAVALESPATIDGVAFDGGDSITHYAVCATGATTADKTASIAGFSLETGASVNIKFSSGNSVANPTLNISGTGAKTIKFFGTTDVANGAWSKEEIVSFAYDGTNWLMVGKGLATTARYGIVKLDAIPTQSSTNAPTSGGVYTQLASKAPLDSPALTGTPTSPTPAAGDNSTKIATTQFVQGEKSSIKELALAAFVQENVSGSIVSFADGADQIPVASLVADINAVQDLHGYDAPWPAGGGTNLIDANEIIPDRRIDATGDPVVDAAFMITGSIPVTAGKKYTFFARDGVSASVDSISFFNDESPKPATFISQEICKGDAAYTVTAPVGALFAVCSYGTAGDQAKFEEGTVPTPYANICPISGWTECNVYAESSYDPAANPTVTVDLGTTIYGGTLEVTTGKLTVTHIGFAFNGSNFVEPVFDPTETETWAVVSTGIRFSPPNAPIYTADATDRNAIICNYYPPYDGVNSGVRISTTGGSIFFYNTGYTDVDAWTSYLATLAQTEPLKIVYPLATPIEVTLTAEEICTALGNNAMWADTGDIDLTYRADTKMYIDAQIAANI